MRGSLTFNITMGHVVYQEFLWASPILHYRLFWVMPGEFQKSWHLGICKYLMLQVNILTVFTENLITLGAVCISGYHANGPMSGLSHIIVLMTCFFPQVSWNDMTLFMFYYASWCIWISVIVPCITYTITKNAIVLMALK